MVNSQVILGIFISMSLALRHDCLVSSRFWFETVKTSILAQRQNLFASWAGKNSQVMNMPGDHILDWFKVLVCKSETCLRTQSGIWGVLSLTFGSG